MGEMMVMMDTTYEISILEIRFVLSDQYIKIINTKINISYSTYIFDTMNELQYV